MGTKYKRIPVPLDERTRQVLEDISAASGVSKSKIIQGFLQEGLPVLEAMRDAYRDVATDRVRAFEHLDRAMIEAVQNAMNERQKAMPWLKEGKADVTDD